MLLHTATCLFAVGFAFIFVPPQLLLEQLARTRGAAGNSATPFLCYRPCLSFRQFLPPFSVPFLYFPPSTLPPSPPFLFFTLPIGPASHCGWSRLSSISPPPPPLTTTPSHYLGPACHCGRSRLVSPPFYLSTSHIRTTLISLTLLTYIPLPLHPFWPGLSLWQVPPTLPISNTLPPLSPSSSSYYHPPLPTLPLELHSGPACHCGRSRHIILSRYISHTSFLALPPTNINLQAYSTSPPSYRPGLPLWLVSPFPITYSFSPLYPPTSSSPIVTWPGLSLW